jgi:hypothetical protein
MATFIVRAVARIGCRPEGGISAVLEVFPLAVFDSAHGEIVVTEYVEADTNQLARSRVTRRLSHALEATGLSSGQYVIRAAASQVYD